MGIDSSYNSPIPKFAKIKSVFFVNLGIKIKQDNIKPLKLKTCGFLCYTWKFPAQYTLEGMADLIFA